MRHVLSPPSLAAKASPSGILQPNDSPALDVISRDTSEKVGVPGGAQIASIPPDIHIEFVDQQNADVQHIMWLP